MPQKNSLAGIKPPDKEKYVPVLPQENKALEVSNDPVTPNSQEPEKPQPATTRKRVGRPPLKKAEKRDYKITLSLTQAQGLAIKKQSGLAGEASFLYNELVKAGVIKQG